MERADCLPSRPGDNPGRSDGSSWLLGVFRVISRCPQQLCRGLRAAHAPAASIQGHRALGVRPSAWHTLLFVPTVPFVGVHGWLPRTQGLWYSWSFACSPLVTLWGAGAVGAWRAQESAQRGRGMAKAGALLSPDLPRPPPPRDASTRPWGLLETAHLSRDTGACSSWGRGSLRHLRIDVCRCLLAQPFLGNPPPSPVCSTSQLARPGNVCCEWDEPLPLSRPRQRM